MNTKGYDFAAIEQNIQSYWKEKGLFEANERSGRPKYYVLDMFPYPSGAGLHVGHLLGYFANDVVAIKARMEGYEVLHPMGFDAFGLPAEQYAIDTGQHPAVTMQKNKVVYKKLLQATGISFCWEREVSTTDENYYRWTQWIFLQFFESWYNKEKDKAEPIKVLRDHFATHGNDGISAFCDYKGHLTADAWRAMSPKEQEGVLACYRLAYLSDTLVNWCPALGTVLANDEVQNGLSERGGHPVERKKMRQWSLRMTAYADRLLAGLEEIAWPEDVKEIQRNWIGRSEGAEISFEVAGEFAESIVVFTTRVDTLFGASYIGLAPEHPLVDKIIKGDIPKQERSDLVALKAYATAAASRSERERMQDAKRVSGIFTGLYAKHPLIDGKKIPIWVTDYVLAGYGSGAVMAVPAHDDRDYAFAKHFELPIIPVIEGGDISEAAYTEQEGMMINAGFANGLTVTEGRRAILKKLVERGRGRTTINYRLHDPVFSRQRYWGEPFPIYYKNERPYPLSEDELPLVLPPIDQYTPQANGLPPLSRAKTWHTKDGSPLEQNTMPAWAGSSWYFLRYMSPQDDEAFVNREAADYWQAVDFYMGGKEHATGHLLYARLFTQLLYDRGFIGIKEPFSRLVNQGMIQAFSRFAYRIKGTNQFVSDGLKENYDTVPLRVDINFVKKGILDLEAFKAWRPDLADATFILEDGHYLCGQALEKMSKSKHNSVDPYPLLKNHGADALRLYLLFLGPIQQAKPWTTEGMEGILRFIKKVWRLFHAGEEGTTRYTSDETPSKEVITLLHRTIKQVQESLTRLTFHTAISALMIAVNGLQEQKCFNKKVLSEIVRLLAPLAPHMAEHLWQELGYRESVLRAGFPTYEEKYLVEESFLYPVAINGKLRARLTAAIDATQEILQQEALALPAIQKWVADKQVKKVIVVSKRMINIVL